MLNKLEAIERQKNALQKLNEIAAISNQIPKETLRQALEVGKDYFGLEFAIVSHIVGEDYTVEVQSSPPDTLFDGQLFALGVTYCNTTLEIDDVLAIKDVVNSKYLGHPCHLEFKLVSYIGAPVRVNSKIYGTINFSSTLARHAEYDETDIEFMRLLARWAGSFLERQFALDNLTESEKRFRMMANSVPVLIWMAGLDKSCYFYNNFSGATMGEEAGSEWSRGVHPEDIENCKKIYYAAFDAGEEFSMEYRRHHCGGYNWVLDKGVPRYDERGGFAGYIGVCIDISARKAVEKALEESELRLRTVIENEPECIKIVDASGRLTQMNPAGLCMIEADFFEQVAMHPILEVIAPEYHAQYSELHKRVLLGETVHMKYEVVGLRGGRRWLETHAAPMQDNGETVQLAVTRDITERKNAEEQLKVLNEKLTIKVEEEVSRRMLAEEERQKEREILIQQSKMAMMGEMIGAIAHQWRQPLNSLAITIQDVLHAHSFEELNEEYLLKFKNDAMNTIRSMSNTIDDFKNFFSPNKKQEQFFIEDAMNETLQMLSAQFKINSIDIMFEMDGLNKHLYVCFKNELKQVFLNLLANAKDAIIEKQPQVKFIKIAIMENDGLYEISIEDSGGGISQEIIGNIFDSYFTTKKESNGTGIGLYMSKEIVEGHLGGKLEVENTENGAKFFVRLPQRR